ncbi:MAG TPA: hypothetical protein VIV60_23430 [Polyangiaceae bacterium]
MNKHIGSTLDSMFEETGELDDVNLRAQKKNMADAVRERMADLAVTKAVLARRMRTSRSQVERLLDPNDTSLTLATVAKASAALGMQVDITVTVARRSGSTLRRSTRARHVV